MAIQGRFQITKSDQMLIVVEMLALLVLFSGASALDPFSTFNFSRKPPVFRKDDYICRMCYGEYDCLTIEKARCEYNAATAVIFNNHDGQQELKDTAVKTQVDAMLNNLMLQESIMENFEECVPIISSYSTCNRENICLGCQTCNCNMEGRWNCTLVQQCRREETIIDHRVLVLVMQKLKSGPNSIRCKRSNEASDNKSTLIRINYEELSQWLYGEKSIQYQHKEAMKRMAHLKELSTKNKRNSVTVENTPKTEVFDEVLSVIGLDVNNSSTSDSMSPYYTNKPDLNNNIDTFLQMLAFEEGKETTEPTLDLTTKVDIKLDNDNSYVATEADNLNERGKNVNEKLNKQILVEHDVNLMDGLGLLNLLSLMKRDINQVNHTIYNTTVEGKIRKGKTNDFKNVTVKVKNNTNQAENLANSENALQAKVLDPIRILIANKHKEVEQLSNIKESLIQFINNYNFNSTLHNETKLELYNNFRRSNSNNNNILVEKYFKKLKVDISEVVRDILGIRKYQKAKDLSNDLKLLLQAITYFLKKNRTNPKEGKSNNREFKGNYKNFRRLFDSINVNANVHPVRGAVLKMLERIDRNMPNSSALSPLSPRAKKVLKRIVIKNYDDDFAIGRLKVNNVNNSKADNLKRIGLKWHELAKNIVNCDAADRLYNMKLLYYTLSHNILQMTDATALSNFFYSRRMSVVDENEQKDIVHRINTVLSDVDNVIRRYISNDESKVKVLENTKHKLSLFKKIKTMLKSSKSDLIKVLHKRSRPYVVKEMARKKMEEERKRKLLRVMQRWQDNLDIASMRNKRSIREYTKLKNRMKNIIPHYLRGKLNPALTAKGKGVRKKNMGYKTRPENKAQTASKKQSEIGTTAARTRTSSIKLKEKKQKH